MSPAFNSLRTQSLIAIAALLLLCWFTYAPALGGSFLYDDWHNLSGLASVHDSFTASQFILSGHAGPLGRPLSLATFAAQASYWDTDARPFIQMNILIHLANTALVFLLFGMLTRSLGGRDKDIHVVAIAGAALWALMPLLASATLLIIQRMATLTVFFCLLGLVLYLYNRRSIDTFPRRSLVGMSISLLLCTGLAVLSKENGALLPTLVLVMESTILRSPQVLSSRHWRTWKSIVLIIPTVLVVVLLVQQSFYSPELAMQRGFSGAQRLATEAVVLWEYVARAVLPQPWKLGPFHDDHDVYRSFFDPVVLPAACAWLVLLVACVCFRRRYRVASFAILWFLAAHLLESTTVPLNLYFEHRNYLAMIGPAFALGYFAFGVEHQFRAAVRIGFGGFIAVSCAILFSVTSMWGQPLVAAGYWHVNAPTSAAAVGELARQQMNEVSAQVGMITLQEFSVARPEHAYLRLPELTLACRINPERDKTELVEYLRLHLSQMSYSPGVGPMFDELLNQTSSASCRDVDPQAIRTLAEEAFENPVYQGADDQSFYHQLLAKIAREQGDLDETVQELLRANAVKRNRQVDLMLVTTLVNAERFDEAENVIEAALQSPPRSPSARLADALMLADLSQYVSAARAYRHGKPLAFDQFPE